MPILKSLLLFILAGLCEIGGGYLIWLFVQARFDYVFKPTEIVFC